MVQDFEKPSETTYDSHPHEINVRRFMNFIEFWIKLHMGCQNASVFCNKYKTAQTAGSIHVEKQG